MEGLSDEALIRHAEALESLTEAMNTFFAFDLELFGIVTGGGLLSWATGHILGRMMQAWRKAM